MARTNVKKKLPLARTHEGAVSRTNRETPLSQLTRVVLAHMLWEDQFYIDGKATTGLIQTLAAKVPVEDLARLAPLARTTFKLRHVPLLLLTVLVDRTRGDVKNTAATVSAIKQTLLRPDEMGELISLYRKTFNTRKLPNVLKRGVAAAFSNFDEYQISKYANKEGDITLRDVMFMVHPTPHRPIYDQLTNKTTQAPATWEVLLSAGADKAETFTSLLQNKKLGGLAFLRNLRNIEQAKVPYSVVKQYFDTAERAMNGVFPFQFFTAYKNTVEYKDLLNKLFLRTMTSRGKFKGTTLIVIDVSGSMWSGQIAKYNSLNRIGAAAALGAIAKEICEDAKIVLTGQRSIVLNTAVSGIPLAEEIEGGPVSCAAGRGGIYLTPAMRFCASKFDNIEFDRVIVITDEQDCGHGSDAPDKAPLLGRHNYLINVGAYQSGIAHNKWTTISGFSDGVFDYISAMENWQG